MNNVAQRFRKQRILKMRANKFSKSTLKDKNNIYNSLLCIERGIE